MVLTDDLINATIAANATFAGIPFKANTTVGEDPPPDALVEHDKEEAAFILTMLFLMLIFFFGAGIMEKFKPRCGHETGFVVLCGVLFSVIFWYSKGIKDVKVFRFSETVFFDFFLPPIIFNSGYNMRRTKFF
jgi:predicted permease